MQHPKRSKPPVVTRPNVKNQVVYVHGVCRHLRGYAECWWKSLVQHGRLPSDQEYEVHEVRWNVLDDNARRASCDALADYPVNWIEPTVDRFFGDLNRYLNDNPRGQDSVRCVAIDRFTKRIRPLLTSNDRVHVFGHSLGSVIAYEALQQLGQNEPGLASGCVTSLFTIGSPLGWLMFINHLKQFNYPIRLERPRLVSKWINVMDIKDLVYLMRRRPLDKLYRGVDVDRTKNLRADSRSCHRDVPFPRMVCPHLDYFHYDNNLVNQRYFAKYIK